MKIHGDFTTSWSRQRRPRGRCCSRRSPTAPAQWPAAESVLTDQAKKYRLTASAVSSDGVSEQTLFKSTAEGTLGKAKLVEEQTAGGSSIRIAAPEGETGIKF